MNKQYKPNPEIGKVTYLLHKTVEVQPSKFSECIPKQFKREQTEKNSSYNYSFLTRSVGKYMEQTVRHLYKQGE